MSLSDPNDPKRPTEPAPDIVHQKDPVPSEEVFEDSEDSEEDDEEYNDLSDEEDEAD